MRQKWCEAVAWKDNDGLLVGGVKLIFGLRIWRLFFSIAVRWILKLLGKLD